MNLEKFKEKYIIDFDNLLHQQNSEFVNSNDHYLEYKNIYLNTTELNVNNFEKLLELQAESTNIYIKDENKKKYTFTYIDKSIKERINIQIKELITNQDKLYIDFMNHIKFLGGL